MEMCDNKGNVLANSCVCLCLGYLVSQSPDNPTQLTFLWFGGVQGGGGLVLLLAHIITLIVRKIRAWLQRIHKPWLQQIQRNH